MHLYVPCISVGITDSFHAGEPFLVISCRDLSCTLEWMEQQTDTQRLIWVSVGSTLVFSPDCDHGII